MKTYNFLVKFEGEEFEHSQGAESLEEAETEAEETLTDLFNSSDFTMILDDSN